MASLELPDIDALPVDQLPEAIAVLERAAARCWLRLGVERAPGGRTPRQWLRVHEAAGRYGIAPATLYDWSHKRLVVTKKLGTARSAPLLFWCPDLEKRARIRPALRAHLDRQ